MQLTNKEQREKIKYFLISNLKYFISTRLKTWYLIWFILISYYLCNHWSEAMNFSPFNGNALIFCVWIAMIIKPFIKEIDTPWIKAKMRETKEEQKSDKTEYEELVAQRDEEQKKAREDFEKTLQKAYKQQNETGDK